MCTCPDNEYDTQVLPLLRRMSNLEELTLDIYNENRTTFVDGTQIKNEILVHMSRLHKFHFYIHIGTIEHHPVCSISSEEVKQTFTNIGYDHVGCIVTNLSFMSTCNIFSIPFVFDHLDYIGNTFPPIVFTHVIHLTLDDEVPFKHEFFIRIASCFPSLKELRLLNSEPQSQLSVKSNSDDHQENPVVQYPYLVSLDLEDAHIDYLEQFLNETKTHLPRLTKLTVRYDRLTIVTENFTREATRLNCARVKQLLLEQTLVLSKNFYLHFPLL